MKAFTVIRFSIRFSGGIPPTPLWSVCAGDITAIPFPAARCLYAAAGNGSMPTVEYRSRQSFRRRGYAAKAA
ncbi:hypothetical protein VC594_20250 [Citrobacter freundii]|uniref:hypothetical protein n=1 Tax=Citrobacter freundii TaxID=546 RepID=UPI00174C3AFA|nr:hypothetical protein [Citrobacter freundii]MDV1741787.1 hypothetical protein [Citrobacter freundii]MEB0490920.1 hypothetical protein [Citrobacter freundii]